MMTMPSRASKEPLSQLTRAPGDEGHSTENAAFLEACDMPARGDKVRRPVKFAARRMQTRHNIVFGGGKDS
jgi:hypothetical protein